MSPLARRLVWVLALAGLAVSLTSLYVHYQLLANPGYASFCDVSETVNCQHAYLSRYQQRVRRSGGAVRQHLVRARAAPRVSGSGGARLGPRVGSTLPVHVLDRRPGRRALHGLRSLLRAQGAVRAVPGHVHRGDWAVHRVGPFAFNASHAYTAPSSCQRPSGARFASTRAVGRARRHRRRGVGGGVLPERGLASHGAGAAGGAPGDRRRAERIRPLLGIAAARDLARAHRRRGGGHRQVQRLPVPGLRPVVFRRPAGAVEVPVAYPGW